MSGGGALRPLPGPPARLPASFGRRFILLVDTEEEFVWSGGFSRSNRSTRAMRALPAFHRRLREAGVAPAYMIDHPVATDAFSADLLRGWREAGECAVGAQLHPWVNPPFEEEVTPRNSFAGNLPRALERAKLHVLTEAIGEAVGARPVVYRAGRYGIGPDTPELLVEAGYRADMSMRAYHYYGDEGGPDYSRIGSRPFWWREGLLEVPFSTAYTGLLARFGRRLYPLLGSPLPRGAMARAGLLNRVSLTPEGVGIGEAVGAVDRLLDTGHRLLSFAFHSPSVEPGHTPYVRDEEDLRAFHRWWERMFAHLARRGVAPASVEEVLAAAG
ncbi:MAG: polysaccharide deacetylase family protein [Sphingomonadaceae bacterium]